MPTLSFFDLARTPMVALAGILLAMGASFTLLALWRRAALRDAAHPERHAWFAFATRVQALVLGAWLVLPAVASPLRLEWQLVARMRVPPALIPPLGWLLPMLFPVVLATAAWFVIVDVERRVRGTTWSLRDRAAMAGRSLGVLLAAVAGLVGAQIALRWHEPRLALACVLGGLLGALALASLRRGVLGLTPEAVTVGALRDRVFELAARAGVKVRQVYVLEARHARHANAFAMTGGNMLLTDHLLAELSRAEVEGVVAHELAHLRRNHPAKLQGVIVGVSALASPLLGVGGGLGFALVFALAWIAFLFASRRFEFEADHGAAELSGDPRALITALVRISRLNHVPLHWGLAREWTLTHPSVRRRAESLARKGLISASDIDALLASPPQDAARWAAETPPMSRVFGTAEKHAGSQRSSWAMLLASVFAPALLIAAVHALALDVPRVALIAAATLASFAVALLVANFMSCAGYTAWRRALEARRSATAGAEERRAASAPVFCGLSPGEGALIYEGYADWDLGFLTLDPGALRYEGELASFAIERERIESVEIAGGLPGWLPTPRVAVSWRAPDGAVRVITVRDASAGALHEFPRRARALAEALRTWRSQDGSAPTPRIAAGDPPDASRVTGRAFAELVAPVTLIPVALLIAAAALLASALTGLPISPQQGAGALEVFGAALLCVIVLRIPAWRTPKTRRREDERTLARAA